MPLQTVESNRLYRQIAEQLRGLIAQGEFAAGTRLPAERDLARQLGVSRPSVREALIALEVEGWVEVRTGSGIYVQPPRRRTTTITTRSAGAKDTEGAEWGPLQLMQARELVEAEVAALAARNARRPQIAQIAQAVAQMREEAAAGVEPRAGDEAFHTAVAQACGNEVLADTVRSYWSARHGPLFLRLGDYFENPASWSAALVEHDAVLEAIRARDAAAARAAMQQHLKKATGRYSASWRRANHS
ncbi:MAG TPA: FadR/GntR family transcriptional regulator [Ramlibacter sp.]|uniref:FadR/GntR family transcriptional regulator n=1 Tax=Ramlibacter sp. TaxID=1917967 RepID=UPI002D804AFC|nr:FadR/GntR family transcriptional regulator [Ramlibacter sp.]HET8745277.1 FadR/GntR family transcriptional regulator [Ramlibacter sp.]